MRPAGTLFSPTKLPKATKTGKQEGVRTRSAMRRRFLVRDAFDRALVGSDGRPGQRLDHGARAFRIGDPLLVEVVWTDRFTADVLAGIDLAGVAAVHQLEQMVLRLHVAPRIADQRLRELGVLNAHVLFAALAQCPAVEADDRRVAEVRINAVEAGRVGYGARNCGGPG